MTEAKGGFDRASEAAHRALTAMVQQHLEEVVGLRAENARLREELSAAREPTRPAGPSAPPAPGVVKPREGTPMTLEEVAAYSGFHKKTLLRDLRRGGLRGYQRVPNGTWRVYQADVDAWLRGEGVRP